MSGFPRGLAIILVIVVLVPAAVLMFFERIGPTEIGVRQMRWGGGIEEVDYATGFHLGVAGVHKWYRLPRNTHFLHFIGTEGRGSRTRQSSLVTLWEPALQLRTKDNNMTTIDVTIPYRIQAGDGWKIVDRGLRSSYRERVKSTVESVLRAQLSELSSEDLQSTGKRLARAQEVLPILNVQLADFHVIADNILIRRVTFPPDYEAKLQEKQYLVQKGFLDGALALQANEEQKTNSFDKQIEATEKQKTADWDKQLQVEKSRYEVLVAQINAMARVYEAKVMATADADRVKLEAEGQLALDRAEALRNELRNQILNSQGGRIFLALEAAANIQLPSITLNSNDPRVPTVLDLEQMTRLLVGED